MKFGKKIISLCIAMIIMVAFFSGCGKEAGSDEEGVINLKFAMVDSETSNYYKGAQKIAEEVDAATDGKIKISIYPNSQLGNERDCWEGASMGTIDITTAANSVMSAFIPEMKVLDQPYLFATAEEAHSVIDGELGDAIAEKAEAMGIHMVGWMESGFRNVFSSRPIETIEDFEGLKIRTMENDTHIAAFNAIGAIATPMAAGDQFTALQQKTIEAGENAVANVLTNNFYDVTPHITYTDHLFVFIGIGVSDTAWNKIPDDLKEPFVEAVKKGCEAQRQYLVEANEEAVDELKKLGVTFYDIDKDTIKEKMDAALEGTKVNLNQDWLKMIEAGK
ncbi:TRAP transporter substrate-binding protein [Alloiococcus sp. CFN-8]|uniref:TRAP transporter substrate-binding protein n=1 Tax=Alloiococcus sp. CFN-8 TaxID=3416081 RepID=UPI003CE881C4